MNTEIEQLLQLEKGVGSNHIEYFLGNTIYDNVLDLTETEFLLIRMLLSNSQSLIQDHLFNKTEPTELETLLCKYLDSALMKLPKEDSVEIVFRETNNIIFSPADVGTDIIYPAYLTASKKCINKDQICVYVIRLNGRTKARSIYKAYKDTSPMEHVAFPKRTKFYVEKVYSKEGKTFVELWERQDYIWPAEQLTNNVSDFFRAITTIDIRDAVNKGLNPQIHFVSSVKGKSINALCTEGGEVYISPTFAQALWNMCYTGLLLADNNITREELGKVGMSLEQVCEEIKKANCVDPRALYFLALNSSLNWEDLIYMNVSLLQNDYSKADDVLIGEIDINGELEKRVNGICMTGMGCILLHELTHYYFKHPQRVANTSRKDLEQEADDKAFDALLSINGDLYQTAILGGLAPFLLGFYRNPPLEPSPNYYREDVRLFRQYDKIKKDKRRFSIFVAYVLIDWLKRFHSRTVDLKIWHEDETVEEIRNIINEL